MIVGVIAQEGRVPPKGTIAFGAFADFEGITTPVVSSGLDQVTRPSRVTDLDAIFAGVDLPLVLAPGFPLPALDLDFDRVFDMRIAVDQLLAPLIYAATDIIHLPDIRIPGFLLPLLHEADDDVIFSTPLILDRGMLRADIVYSDTEAVYLPTVIAPQTLAASLLVDVADVFYAPQVRHGIGPPFVLSDDDIPRLISTSYYRPSRVFDEARPVTPVGKLDGSPTFVTISTDQLTATRNLGYNNNACGARSKMSFDRGKFYFEVTIVHIGGSNDGIGILLPTASYATMSGHGSSVTGVFQNGGVIWSDGQPYDVRLGNLWHGDVIGVAIDFDNHRAWFRKNGDRWNGLIYNQDIPTYPINPSLNLGGVRVGQGEFAPACIFHGGTVGDEMRFNFGATAFQSPMPEGFDYWRIPSPFPPSQTADRFGEVYAATPATLDAEPSAAVVSTDGLTVTKTGAMLGTAAGWSASGQNYGKFYFEVMVNSTHGSDDFIGLVLQITNSYQMRGGASFVYLSYNSGAIYSNYGYPGKSLGRNVVAGDVVGVAVDLSFQNSIYGGEIWFRLNGGLWNNDTTQPCDPETGAGGIKIGGTSYSNYWYPAIGFAGSASANGDQMTANFGQSPYYSPAPVGYSVWPQKIIDIILPIKAAIPQDMADDFFHVPFADLNIKILVHGTRFDDNDIIYGSDSFGGNLFFYPNFMLPSDDIILAAGNYATFGSGLESPNVTVTNNGRTATMTSSVSNTGARSVNFQSGPLAKYYFEITGNTIHSSEGAGLLLSTGTYFNMSNNGTNCVTVFANTGNIYSNNGYVSKSIGAFSSGTTLSFAVDFQFRKGWIRKGGGLWNNDPAADPSSNIGGFNIGAGAFAPAVTFGGGGQVIGDAWTGNFGSVDFLYPIPEDFARGWPGSADMTLVQVGSVVQDNLIELPFPTPFVQNQNQILSHPTAPVHDDSIKAAKFAAGTPAVLDGATVDVTMSNGNKTATHSTTVTNSGARSTTQKSAGNYYFEVTVGQTTGIGDSAGLIQVTSAYSDIVASQNNSFIVKMTTGNIYGGNINSGFTLGPIVAGDVLGFAVNFDAQAGYGRGWVSKNGGLWNNNATANPVTNTNGALYNSGYLYVPAVGFGGTGTAIGDNVTINCGPAFASGNANPSGFGDWLVIPPSLLASFDGAATNVTLSNANLTATHTTTTTDSGARSTSIKGTGKYYFEVTMTNLHGAFDCCGILIAGATYTNMVTSGTQCSVVYKDGRIFSNSANTAKTLAAIANGDVIGVAVDLTARRVWLRKNGGNWNGDVITTANPVTGIGGVAIPVAVVTNFAPAVGFGGTGTAVGDAMTANFGSTTYQSAAPTGFLNWTVA